MQKYRWLAIRSITRSVCLIAMIGVLSSCVSREVVEQAPHINLSPEDLALGDMQTDSADVGLSVALNESDSLMDLAVLPGLRVRRVDANSLADLAGVRSGDVILSVNGIDTNQPDTLYRLLSEKDSNVSESDASEKVFELVVRRDTAMLNIPLSINHTTRTVPQEIARVDPIKTRAAYRLEENAAGQMVLNVIAIFDESPLTTAGIGQGDLITSVNGDPVKSAQAFVDELITQADFGETITVMVESANSEGSKESREVDVTLWKPRKKVTGVKFWPLFTYGASADGNAMRWSVLDFWLVWLFAYEREESEKSVNMLRLIEFSTGYGELTEE